MSMELGPPQHCPGPDCVSFTYVHLTDVGPLMWMPVNEMDGWWVLDEEEQVVRFRVVLRVHRCPSSEALLIERAECPKCKMPAGTDCLNMANKSTHTKWVHRERWVNWDPK